MSYSYDAQVRLTRVMDAAGGLTDYTWDPVITNRMLTLKDPRGIVYLTNEYDSAGRISRQTQGDGSTYQFGYTLDANGQLIQTEVTDPRGNLRRVSFEATTGYPTSDTRAVGTSIQQGESYTRNSSNLLTSLTDALNR